MKKNERILKNAMTGRTRNLTKLAHEAGSTVEATRFYINRLQRQGKLSVSFINGPRGGVNVVLRPGMNHPCFQ